MPNLPVTNQLTPTRDGEPRDGLAAWRSIKPIVILRQFDDGTVDMRRTDVDGGTDGKEVLLLLGGEAGLARRDGGDMAGAPQ